MAFGIGLTPAQIARKDREYGSSQGSPFANSARSRNPHPPLSLTNKGRGHSKSNVKLYKLQTRAGTPAPLCWTGVLTLVALTSTEAEKNRSSAVCPKWTPGYTLTCGRPAAWRTLF